MYTCSICKAIKQLRQTLYLPQYFLYFDAQKGQKVPKVHGYMVYCETIVFIVNGIRVC